MKSFSCPTILLLALGLTSSSLFAETVTLVAANGASGTITLAANEVATSVFFSTGAVVSVNTGGTFFQFGPADKPVFAGPASLFLQGASNAKYIATFQIQRATDQFVPSNAVVIPADGLGPVTIILESSTDLLNWTPALPGTYGTTTTNRFFRVRAQRN